MISWTLTNKSNWHEVKEFISKNEVECFNIAGLLFVNGRYFLPHNSKAILLFNKIENKIYDLVLITFYGHIIFFNKSEIDKKSFDFILDLSNKFCKNNITQIIGNLSISKYLNNPTTFSILKYNPQHNTIKETTNIYQSTKDDAQQLFKLHYNYYKEEVFREREKPTNKLISNDINKLIEKKLIYHIKDKKNIISKININLESKNFVRLGGVYTKKEFRSMGYAKLLINSFLQKELLKYNKNCILFVNKDNAPAKNLYKKLGFIKISDMIIFYY